MNNRKNAFGIASLSLLSVLSFNAVPASSQVAADAPPVVTTTTEHPLTLAALQFDAWLLPQIRALDSERQQPNADLFSIARRLDALNEIVVERLKLGRTVSESTLLSAVHYRMFLELDMVKQTLVGTLIISKPVPSKLPQTQQLIHRILEQTKPPSLMIARLHNLSARLFAQAGENAAALTEYEKSMPMLNNLGLAADIESISTLVAAADVCAKVGYLSKADDLYLQARSYPWYTVRATEPFHRFRQLYIDATLGLIHVRKGNTSKLKDISIIPAVSRAIAPALQQALKTAQNSEKSAP